MLNFSQAFLCTDPDLDPAAIPGRFVFRCWIETTFQEVREHLGVETQRQWSDLAILRTTSARSRSAGPQPSRVRQAANVHA